MSQVLGKALKRCTKHSPALDRCQAFGYPGCHSPVLVLKKGSVECKSWVMDKAKGEVSGILESELIA